MLPSRRMWAGLAAALNLFSDLCIFFLLPPFDTEFIHQEKSLQSEELIKKCCCVVAPWLVFQATHCCCHRYTAGRCNVTRTTSCPLNKYWYQTSAIPITMLSEPRLLPLSATEGGWAVPQHSPTTWQPRVAQLRTAPAQSLPAHASLQPPATQEPFCSYLSVVTSKSTSKWLQGGCFSSPRYTLECKMQKDFPLLSRKKKKKDIWKNTVQNMFHRKKFKINSGQKGELGSEMLRRLHITLVQKHCGHRVRWQPWWVQIDFVGLTFQNLRLFLTSHCRPMHNVHCLPPASQWCGAPSLARQTAFPKPSPKHQGRPSGSWELPPEATAMHRTRSCLQDQAVLQKAFFFFMN